MNSVQITFYLGHVTQFHWATRAISTGKILRAMHLGPNWFESPKKGLKALPTNTDGALIFILLAVNWRPYHSWILGLVSFVSPRNSPVPVGLFLVDVECLFGNKLKVSFFFLNYLPFVNLAFPFFFFFFFFVLILFQII